MMRDIRHLTNVQFTRIQKIEIVNWLWIDGLTKNMPQNCRISLITDIKKQQSLFSMNTKKEWRPQYGKADTFEN